MKIGDKVRLLRGTEEGYIKAIRGNIIDVEIEDGFVIPSVKNEVVLVNRRESEVFRKESEPAPKPEFDLNYLPGILYLGISSATQSGHQLVFINRTDNTVLICAYQYDKKVYRRVMTEVCPPDSLITSENGLLSVSSGQIKIRVQLIRSQRETKLPFQPEEIDLELKTDQFRFDTYLEKMKLDVHLVRLEPTTPDAVDPALLKLSMTETADIPVTKEKTIRVMERSVDLHIEKTNTDLTEGQIYSYQLELFEKAFDSALVSNVEKLKIIHGIGSGKLRMEIHKRLSNRKEVRYFEDADKDRFGYGATVIYF